MSRDAGTRSSRPAGLLGTAVGLTAAVLLVASCSSSPPDQAGKPGAPASQQAGTAATPAPGTSAPASGTSTGPLGSTLAVDDSSGTQLGVTLQQVIDPASGANQYTSPANGNHVVGVKLSVHNTATSTYQNNANNETTITLSDGKTIHADYQPIAGCGNFSSGQITLKSGATSTGCVTFQVPKGQKVTQVGYGNTVFPGKNAEWHVS